MFSFRFFASVQIKVRLFSIETIYVVHKYVPTKVFKQSFWKVINVEMDSFLIIQLRQKSLEEKPETERHVGDLTFVKENSSFLKVKTGQILWKICLVTTPLWPLAQAIQLWMPLLQQTLWFKANKLPILGRILGKVHIFWKGHKILRNLHLLCPSQNIWTLLSKKQTTSFPTFPPNF